MTGKTISMEMMTDKFFPENHSSTKMMNDATGVALITAVMGRRRVSTTQNREATHPSTVPSVSAVKNPPKMRAAEYHTVFKKLGSKMTVNSVCTTFTGETSTSSEPTQRLTTCHTNSQKATAHVAAMAFCFFVFTFFCFAGLFRIVESVIGQRSSNRLRVGVKEHL